MGHRSKPWLKPPETRSEENISQRFREYMARELHPDTARNIGEIVLHTHIRPEEAMGIILEMRLDHLRQNQELQVEGQMNFEDITRVDL